MHKLPADAEMLVDDAGPAAGDAMSHGADFPELFDVEMEQFTWVLALIASDGLWLQGAEFVQTQSSQNPADAGRRDPNFRGDRLAGQTLAAQQLHNSLRRGLAQPPWPRGTILQSGQPFAMIATYPFANCPRADAYGLADGLRRLPARIELYDPFSTARRQPGILVHVHPVLLLEC
jgi:hypothetical protein